MPFSFICFEQSFLIKTLSVVCYYFLQGHLLLIGVSGAGKTTLSRFVAWMNGLSIVQVKVCQPHLKTKLANDSIRFCFHTLSRKC